MKYSVALWQGRRTLPAAISGKPDGRRKYLANVMFWRAVYPRTEGTLKSSGSHFRAFNSPETSKPAKRRGLIAIFFKFGVFEGIALPKEVDLVQSLLNRLDMAGTSAALSFEGPILLSLAAVSNPRFQGRKQENFLFSPLFAGSSKGKPKQWVLAPS